MTTRENERKATAKATPLTERQQTLLEQYRALWVDFSAVNGLIEQLEVRRNEIKNDQRRLANLIAAAEEPDPLEVSSE
jgi:hypothetical protein